MVTKQVATRTKQTLSKTSGQLPVPPKAAEWVICDISGSMGTLLRDPETNQLTSKSRIDCLNAALNELGDDIQVIAFSDEISRERIGAFTPQGGTSICPALREVVKHEPSYIIVISDGQITDSVNEALGLVDKIAKSAVIDTIYIGPDDAQAEKFMRNVAEAGHGRFRKYEASQTGDKIQQLLPPPKDTVAL